MFLLVQGVHFLMTLKGTQPKLLKQFESLPGAEVPYGNEQRDTGHQHGRKSIRRIKVSTLTGGIRFPHAV